MRNSIDISELLTGDEDGDSVDTDGNEPSVGGISIDNALITDNGDEHLHPYYTGGELQR
ncbi:hypothetical protein OH492_17865 [Vibrio chagasii]|nr:hypothetical protein [Vibrio chagasii]